MVLFSFTPQFILFDNRRSKCFNPLLFFCPSPDSRPGSRDGEVPIPFYLFFLLAMAMGEVEIRAPFFSWVDFFSSTLVVDCLLSHFRLGFNSFLFLPSWYLCLLGPYLTLFPPPPFFVSPSFCSCCDRPPEDAISPSTFFFRVIPPPEFSDQQWQLQATFKTPPVRCPPPPPGGNVM